MNLHLTGYELPSESITVLNNNGSLTKIFIENGSFAFEFIDVAGNSGIYTVTVSCIDKVPPVVTLSNILEAITDIRNIEIEISGNDVIAYRYKINEKYCWLKI